MDNLGTRNINATSPTVIKKVKILSNIYPYILGTAFRNL